MSLRSLFAFSILLLTNGPFANSSNCCGGGSSSAPMILNDDFAQLKTSYALTTITRDVGPDGTMHTRSKPETLETLQIQTSRILSDRWQIGLSLPVSRRSRNNQSAEGLGDVSTSLGYEILPDWDYNPYRPHGVSYIQITAPTGHSVYETQTSNQLDVHGRGFYSLGLGLLLNKNINRFDLFSSVEVHRSLERQMQTLDGPASIRPGFGGSVSLGVGYNLSSIRFGSNLQMNYEDSIDVGGVTPTRGAPQREYLVSLSALYNLPENWNLLISYADPFIIGAPSNTALGSTWQMSLAKSWVR